MAEKMSVQEQNKQIGMLALQLKERLRTMFNQVFTLKQTEDELTAAEQEAIKKWRATFASSLEKLVRLLEATKGKKAGQYQSYSRTLKNAIPRVQTEELEDLIDDVEKALQEIANIANSK